MRYVYDNFRISRNIITCNVIKTDIALVMFADKRTINLYNLYICGLAMVNLQKKPGKDL